MPVCHLLKRPDNFITIACPECIQNLKRWIPAAKPVITLLLTDNLPGCIISVYQDCPLSIDYDDVIHLIIIHPVNILTCNPVLLAFKKSTPA